MSTRENLSKMIIEIPKEEHIQLKMLALKEGKSLRQLVVEHLNSLIPKEKRWIYDPKNKELVKSLKKRIKEEKATIDLGSFKKYVKE